MISEKDGRNLDDAKPLDIPNSVANLKVEPGDDRGRAAAIARIKQATSKLPAQDTKQAIQTQNTSVDAPLEVSDEPTLVTDESEDVASTVAEQDIAPNDSPTPVTKRSVALDDLDELIFTHKGQEIILSKDELAKGAGLYAANNLKAEELARERKAVAAEKATWAAKASQEATATSNDIQTLENRNNQLDEWLAIAYKANAPALKMQDGSTIEVKHLENEQKANAITIKKLNLQKEQKAKELEQYAADYRERRDAQLRERDSKLADNLDGLAHYLKKTGDFSEQQANFLAYDTEVGLLTLIDKARKYDAAINAAPQRKKVTETKVISRGSSRNERVANTTSNHIQKLRETVSKATPGSSAYVNGLRELRKAQRYSH